MKTLLKTKMHKTGTRKEWLAARLALLKAEKALTHKSDELAQKRQALPWVRIDKPYRFETAEGSSTLKDLFRGRSQLMIYHFMFGPDYTAGCPVCSSMADGFNGFAVHLANHDVTLGAVSRAPYARIAAYQKRMGWTFPWASSSGNDFNADFNFSKGTIRSRANDIGAGDVAPEVGTMIAATTGTDWATYSREVPALSAFALEDGIIYHTYSTYARGLDGLLGFYPWLDRAPKGRNETSFWLKRHDEYDNQ